MRGFISIDYRVLVLAALFALAGRGGWLMPLGWGEYVGVDSCMQVYIHTLQQPVVCSAQLIS